MQSISEDQSDDDEPQDSDDGATRDPPADPDNLEEDDVDVDQIGDSDDEVPDKNWEP